MSESHDPRGAAAPPDPWESARGSQREEVQAIWANRGAPAPRPPRERDWARLARIAIPALVLIGVVAFVLVPSLREDADREEKAAAAAQARLEEQERARLRAEGVPVHARGPAPREGESTVAYRARLVAAAETAITADAKRRIATGEFDGEVNGTQCRTFPYTSTREAQEADPAIERNRYQCTAFSRRFDLPDLNGRERTGVIGRPYWLVADYGTGALTFCKISPRAGEGGKSLAVVPVDPECRDPLRA